MTELQNYDKTMYTELDRLAQLEFAEQRGEQRGEKKGREKGREEGRNARSEEIAQKMQDAGMAPDLIKEMTGIEL